VAGKRKQVWAGWRTRYAKKGAVQASRGQVFISRSQALGGGREARTDTQAQKGPQFRWENSKGGEEAPAYGEEKNAKEVDEGGIR